MVIVCVYSYINVLKSLSFQTQKSQKNHFLHKKFVKSNTQLKTTLPIKEDMKHIIIEEETHKQLMLRKIEQNLTSIDETIWELLENERKRTTQEN